MLQKLTITELLAASLTNKLWSSAKFSEEDFHSSVELSSKLHSVWELSFFNLGETELRVFLWHTEAIFAMLQKKFILFSKYSSLIIFDGATPNEYKYSTDNLLQSKTRKLMTQ